MTRLHTRLRVQQSDYQSIINHILFSRLRCQRTVTKNLETPQFNILIRNNKKKKIELLKLLFQCLWCSSGFCFRSSALFHLDNVAKELRVHPLLCPLLAFTRITPKARPSPMSWFDHAIRTEDVLNRACVHVWHSGPRFGRPLSIVPSHEIAPCPGAVELTLALESILFGGWCAWLECTLSVTSSHTHVDGIQPCWDLKLWRQWRMTHHKKLEPLKFWWVTSAVI